MLQLCGLCREMHIDATVFLIRNASDVLFTQISVPYKLTQVDTRSYYGAQRQWPVLIHS